MEPLLTRPSLANALLARAVHFTRRPAHTQPTTTRSDSSSGQTRVLSSKTRCWRFGFSSLPSKPVQLDLPEERTTSCDFKFSDKFSSTIWQISNTRSGDSRHDLGEKHWIWRNLCQIRLDRTESWTDRERFCQFSTFLVLFGGFRPYLKPPLTRQEIDP